MRRILRGLSGLLPAALAGAFSLMSVFRVADPSQARFGLLLFGALYGIGVLGLIRLFRVARWAYPVVGLICGPVPLALLVGLGGGTAGDERGFLYLLGSLLGLAIGVLECARLQRLERADDDR